MNDVDAVVAGVGHVVDAHLCPDVRDAPSSSTVESIKQSMIFCRVYKKYKDGEAELFKIILRGALQKKYILCGHVRLGGGGGDPCPLRKCKFLFGQN